MLRIKDICIDFSGIEEISKNNLVGFVSKIKKKICSIIHIQLF